MAQFTQYSSSDASGPGLITGEVGEVLRVLDLCLVNGYTGKTAAGWTKPIANSGNIGCYTQGTGSAGFSILINDNAPNATSLAKEAWATGWKTLTAITGPVGTGTGQFPTAAQLLTTGHVVIRKSATASNVGRSWVLYADSRTFYFFIASGDTASTYLDYGFGDFYSLWSTDTNRCFIAGRNQENSANTTATVGHLCKCTSPLVTSSHLGVYLADNQAGSSGSLIAYVMGDMGKLAALPTASTALGLTGSVPTPNSADNSYYLSPLQVMESSWAVRGRFRGLHHIAHASSNFSDGQTFSGANDYSGKTFRVILNTIAATANTACVGVETSATLESN